MKPYDWLYLCADLRRLKVTLKFLPATAPANLRLMRVCFPGHQLPASFYDDVTRILQANAPAWLRWQVFDVSGGRRYIPTNLLPYFDGQKDQRANWAIGVILTLPCQFEAPFLYTDDDVLLIQDPQPIIDRCSTGWGATNMLSRVPEDVLRGLAATFDLENFTAEVYAQHRLGGGVWFVDDKRDWVERLWKLGEQDYVRERLTNYPNRWESRRFTQRFLTAFGMKYGFTPIRSAYEIKTIYQSVDKFNVSSCVRGRCFFHYAVPYPHKAAWVDALELHP